MLRRQHATAALALVIMLCAGLQAICRPVEELRPGSVGQELQHLGHVHLAFLGAGAEPNWLKHALPNIMTETLQSAKMARARVRVCAAWPCAGRGGPNSAGRHALALQVVERFDGVLKVRHDLTEQCRKGGGRHASSAITQGCCCEGISSHPVTGRDDSVGAGARADWQSCHGEVVGEREAKQASLCRRENSHASC